MKPLLECLNLRRVALLGSALILASASCQSATSQMSNSSGSSPRYVGLASQTAGPCVSVGPRQWVTDPPTTAKMIDGRSGWAAGPLSTNDGGSHWTAAFPPSIPRRAPINDIYFLDARHGWVAETSSASASCVDQLVIFRTSDGGRSWAESEPIPIRHANPSDVVWAGASDASNWFSFLDPEHGWLLVGSAPDEPAGVSPTWMTSDLYSTTDGGAHWTHVSTNPGSITGCSSGRAFSFSSLETAWILADCGLLVSRDGGLSWTPLSLPLTPTRPPLFFGARVGLLEAVEGVLVTADGGLTWTARSSPTAGAIAALDFVSPEQGWALSFLGNDPNQSEFGLYETLDAAQTWTVVNTTTLPHLPPATYWRTKGLDAGDWGLDFVNARTGFWTICGGPPGPCLGDGFYRTDDGGRSWRVVTEHTPFDH